MEDKIDKNRKYEFAAFEVWVSPNLKTTEGRTTFERTKNPAGWAVRVLVNPNLPASFAAEVLRNIAGTIEVGGVPQPNPLPTPVDDTPF